MPSVIAITERRPALGRPSITRKNSSAGGNPSYKAILLGDSGVGKTSLFLRLTQGMFFERGQPTISMDIGRKVFRVQTCDRYFMQSESAASEVDDSKVRQSLNCMTSQQMKADSTPTTLQNFSPMKQTAQFDDVAVLRTECDVNL